MSKRIFCLTNVHLSDKNINKFKKKNRKTIIRKRSRLNLWGIAAIMDIGHIFFTIVSV